MFVDEDYIELLEDADKQSMVSLVAEGKNVIIARTFSKIYGMAGLRVGYVVAQEETLAVIQRITRAGMGIIYPSEMAAHASLDDVDFQKKSWTLNTEAKEFLYSELEKMGFDYLPSYTSFVLFPIEMEGKTFLKEMQSKQVAVRSLEIGERNWCRVSIGKLEEMKLFVNALGSV